MREAEASPGLAHQPSIVNRRRPFGVASPGRGGWRTGTRNTGHALGTGICLSPWPRGQRPLAAGNSIALDAYSRKEPVLLTALDKRERTRTPRFSWNLVIPEKWQEAVYTWAGKKLPPGWRK